MTTFSRSTVRSKFRTRFLHDVLSGLLDTRKSLPCKYLYDQRGSALFDEICELPEYYTTRTEAAIMQQYVAEMVTAIGPDSTVIEYGSGSSTKTRAMLDLLADGATYVPVDISDEHLHKTAEELAAAYPKLYIHPVTADFTGRLRLELPENRSRMVYFPGSTIGNFQTDEAITLLENIREVVGDDGHLLIGVDLWKSPEILQPAYDDRAGTTAEFNLNLLTRINRELDADFNEDNFRHHVVVSESRQRVELSLQSLCEQSVTINGIEIPFAEGELIHTENSHKYTQIRFDRVAHAAGFEIEQVWRDDDDLFSVQLLRAV